jgi:hypothetical protein
VRIGLPIGFILPAIDDVLVVGAPADRDVVQAERDKLPVIVIHTL